MPTCRALTGGFWEVRSSLPSKREARVLFAVVDDRMVLLHAFIKKAQKTPKGDMDTARKRLKDVKR